MSIQQKPNGKWLVRWLANGKHRGKTFDTEAEAHEFDDFLSSKVLSQWRHGLPLGEGIVADDDFGITVGEWVHEWFDDHAAGWANPGPARAMTNSLGDMADVPLVELDLRHAVRWQNGLRSGDTSPSGRPLAESSVNQYTSQLRMAYAYALDTEVIPKDRLRKLSSKVKRERISKRKGAAHYVDPQTMAAMADAAPPRLRAYLLTLYLTGLRASEAGALTIDDLLVRVDGQPIPYAHVDDVTGLDGLLRANKHVARTLASDGWTILHQPGIKQDRNADFLVPITASTVGMLDRHIAEFGLGRPGIMTDDSGDVGELLFSNRVGGSSVRQLPREWRKVREVVGDHYVPHDLRHSLIEDMERLVGHRVAADFVRHSVAGSQTLSYTFESSDEVLRDAAEQRAAMIDKFLYREEVVPIAA